MKKFIRIENVGEINPLAFQLLGASTKADNASKIGEFGSGANYAIAWLMRNNVDFHVYSGQTKIDFTVNPVQMGDSVFETIEINGRETGLTTSMGRGWEPWWCLREFWCNALDEGGEKMEVVSHEDEDDCGTEGCTVILIELVPELQKVVDNWSDYFLDRSKIRYTEAGISVLPGGADLVVYRKGIRVLHLAGERSVYHYDFDEISINESRVVKDSMMMRFNLTKWWAAHAPAEAIEYLLLYMKGKTFEDNLNWEYYDSDLGENWEKALNGKTVVERNMAGHYVDDIVAEQPAVLPHDLAVGLIKNLDIDHVAGSFGNVGITTRKAYENEMYMLKLARVFFDETEYDQPYPIECCSFTKSNTVARAHEGTIYLCDKAFKGRRELVAAIIEEAEHLKTKFGDETRAFQNHWIDLFIDEKCARYAYTL